MKIRYLVTFIVVLILGIVLAIYWGKMQADTRVTNIATNEILIKEIAELSALEVQGNAQINESNIINDGSLTSNIKKWFIEQSIQLSIPYVAKYGIKTDSSNFSVVKQENNSLLIHVPEPELLSLEMNLDKAMQSSSQGWLQFQDYEKLNSVQKKLYLKARKELEKSEKNKDLAKQKIIKILTQYYKPLGWKVEVQFGKSSGVLINLN